MTVAYLIVAHEAPHHLARLLAALRGHDSRIFVHLDAKSDAADFTGLAGDASRERRSPDDRLEDVLVRAERVPEELHDGRVPPGEVEDVAGGGARQCPPRVAPVRHEPAETGGHVAVARHDAGLHEQPQRLLADRPLTRRAQAVHAESEKRLAPAGRGHGGEVDELLLGPLGEVPGDV